MHCRVRGLIVPVMLIAVGTLFLIAEYTRFSFLDLWPVLLIVLGGILVCQAMVSREGHTGS
jgi:hypothetical protein